MKNVDIYVIQNNIVKNFGQQDAESYQLYSPEITKQYPALNTFEEQHYQETMLKGKDSLVYYTCSFKDTVEYKYFQVMYNTSTSHYNKQIEILQRQSHINYLCKSTKNKKQKKMLLEELAKINAAFLHSFDFQNIKFSTIQIPKYGNYELPRPSGCRENVFLPQTIKCD